MFTLVKPPFEYQVGGSLPINAPSYVSRQADRDLYDCLAKGEFCYVLNSRQMGKSSLRIQTMQRLQTVGIACAVIDITSIGTQQVSLEQWYASMIGSLANSFQIKFDLRSWWRDRDLLSPVQRLSEFCEQVLLPATGQDIVIFIDEIDSVLSLKFPIDDFFALIRAFYNTRTEKPEFNRLTFALLGVATPSDLIRDKTRTPFNIGRAICLTGLQFHEAQALMTGLVGKGYSPEALLQEVLNWTNGQPFLTQKLCQIILRSPLNIETQQNSSAADWVEQLVRSHLIEHWEASDAPEHFKTIRDRLLCGEQRTGSLLGLYQRIILDREIPSDDSLEQVELRLSGLVVEREGRNSLPVLTVYNSIYASIFTQAWTEKALADLRPYANALNAWISSNYQDESRLLRGQALQDAIAWSANKNLSNQDYQFMTASQTADKQEVEIMLKAEREANRRVSIILESITNAFYALDRDWRFTYINRLCADLLQANPAELLGKCIWEVFPQAVGSIFYINYHKAVAEKTTLRFEALGTIIPTKWFEVQVHPSMDGNGISIYFTDISERKRLEFERQLAEEALRESEKRYRLLFDNGADAVFVHEYGDIRRNKFIEVNDIACQQLGYTRAELLQMSPANIIPADRGEPDLSILEQFRRDKQAVFEAIHITKDGCKIPVEIKATLFDVNGKPTVLAFARDISERKQIELALRDSEARFRAIFDQAAVGIAQITLDGKFVNVNPAMSKLTGYSSNELLEMSVQQITHPEDLERDLELMRQLHLRTIDRFTLKKRYIHKDGLIVWGNLTSSLVLDASGIPKYSLGIVEDIREQTL